MWKSENGVADRQVERPVVPLVGDLPDDPTAAHRRSCSLAVAGKVWRSYDPYGQGVYSALFLSVTLTFALFSDMDEFKLAFQQGMFLYISLPQSVITYENENYSDNIIISINYMISLY